MSHPSSRKQLVLGMCVVFAAGVATAETAEGAEARPAAKHAHAGERHARGSYTQTTQTQRTANGHTTNTVRTDAHGRTSTRDATVTNDKDSGTRTKDVTFTGKDGEARTANTVTQRTEDGRTSTTVITDAQGRTTTREAEVDARRRYAHHGEDRHDRSRDSALKIGASGHGGCGVVLVRTRSSRPWSLSRRQPC